MSNDDKQENYNIQTYYDNKDDGVNEGDRLRFAKQILLFLFIIIIFVFSASYYLINFNSDNKDLVSIINTILDITKTVVPSTATLVLGFYFGRKDS